MAKENSNIDVLKARLEEEDTFLQQLIDTIPPKFYFDQSIQEKLTADKHAAMDVKEIELKKSFQYRKGITVKAKHKRAHLDPQCQKTVSQIQREMNEVNRITRKKDIPFQSVSLSKAANLEELQQRLQERIRQLQSKRSAHSGNKIAERKKLKNKLKKVNKQKKKQLKTAVNGMKQETLSADKTQSQLKPKPVYNKEGKMIYSKFDFSNLGTASEQKQSEFSGKKYKKLLHNVEKEKEKISNIEKTNPEKAKDIKSKKIWNRAIQKIEGVKVRDDPLLLKKALKKQEQMKQKSSKLWEKRKQHTQNMQKARQNKRKENIKARKQEKLDKKLKRAKKRGRIIAGF